MKTGHTKYSRRFLLKQLGLLGGVSVLNDPIQILTQALTSSLIQRAYAEEVGSVAMNYFYLNLYGAPPRWHYDLILQTQDNEPFVPNSTVATRYTATGQNTQYATVIQQTPTQKLRLPYFWSFDLPAPGGKRVSPKVTLENWLNIRGIDMLTDGHSLNMKRQLQPVVGAHTITGRSADRSQTPFGCVSLWNDMLPFSSAKNSVSQFVSYAAKKNILKDNVLKNFTHVAPNNMKLLKSERELALESAISEIHKHTESGLPGASTLKKDRAFAEYLLRQSFSDVGDFWQVTLAKYELLIRRALASHSAFSSHADLYPSGIVGISDRQLGAPVGSRSNAAGYSCNHSQGDGIAETVTNADLRTLISDSTTLPMLAETFVVAEYLLTRGLVTTMTSTLTSSLANIQLQEGSQNFITSLINDQHNTGHMIGTFLNFFYFRAIHACLTEFISVLKATQAKGELNTTLFDKTLIHVGSEFNRSARNNGTGADHGFGAQSISLYSGQIRNAQVIGNIYNTSNRNEDPNSTYAGTWGEGAPTQMNGSSQKFTVHMDHVGETILNILGLPGLSANAYSVAHRDGRSLIENAKIVTR